MSNEFLLIWFSHLTVLSAKMYIIYIRMLSHNGKYRHVLEIVRSICSRDTSILDKCIKLACLWCGLDKVQHVDFYFVPTKGCKEVVHVKYITRGVKRMSLLPTNILNAYSTWIDEESLYLGIKTCSYSNCDPNASCLRLCNDHMHEDPFDPNVKVFKGIEVEK